VPVMPRFTQSKRIAPSSQTESTRQGDGVLHGCDCDRLGGGKGKKRFEWNVAGRNNKWPRTVSMFLLLELFAYASCLS
jgi:hypothetical protein